MAPNNFQRADDIDLRSLWQAAIASIPRLFLISAALAAATYGVLMLIAPRYVSETQLTIDSKSANNPFADPSRVSYSDSPSLRMDKEAINTHVRALMSSDLGEKIVREMKLDELPEFNSAKGSPDEMSALLRIVGVGEPRASETDQDRALTSFFKHLEVYSPKESRLIGVRFNSMDAELAAGVANRIAETYRENLARQSLTETDDVQKALEPKITQLAEEAAVAEAEVEKFRGQANIFKGGQQATGLNEQQLAELNAELSKVKAARSEAEARAKQAREMQDLGSADTLGDVQKSPLIQNLVQSRVRVERQLSELSATLLPGHPRMRQLQADLKGLKAQIAVEVGKIVDGIGKESRVSALREEAVQKSVDEIKGRIVTSGPEEAKLRSLEADARSKRAELDRLRAQYEANRVRSDDSRTIPVEVQIVSSARPSTIPYFPKKGATALLVGVASLLIGLALVVTHGLLTGANPAQSRSRRNRRVTPVLPDRAQALDRSADRATDRAPVSNRAEAAAAPSTAEPASTIPVRWKQAPAADRAPAPVAPSAPEQEPEETALAAEVRGSAREAGSFASLKSPDALAGELEALRGAGGLAGIRTLFAASADVFSLARESAALCRALADRGLTVMLVDWSLNGSGVSEPLGEPAWPGFTELIEGEQRFEDVVRSLRDSDVHIIPCGRSLSPGVEVASDSVSFLLDALDDVYDHIVVVARTEPAQALFETIQGRFDCGVTLVETEGEKARAAAGGNSFLGFEVDGISLFALEKSASDAAPRRQKLARAG